MFFEYTVTCAGLAVRSGSSVTTGVEVVSADVAGEGRRLSGVIRVGVAGVSEHATLAETIAKTMNACERFLFMVLLRAKATSRGALRGAGRSHLSEPTRRELGRGRWCTREGQEQCLTSMLETRTSAD